LKRLLVAELAHLVAELGWPDGCCHRNAGPNQEHFKDLINEPGRRQFRGPHKGPSAVETPPIPLETKQEQVKRQSDDQAGTLPVLEKGEPLPSLLWKSA